MSVRLFAYALLLLPSVLTHLYILYIVGATISTRTLPAGFSAEQYYSLVDQYWVLYIGLSVMYAVAGLTFWVYAAWKGKEMPLAGKIFAAVWFLAMASLFIGNFNAVVEDKGVAIGAYAIPLIISTALSLMWGLYATSSAQRRYLAVQAVFYFAFAWMPAYILYGQEIPLSRMFRDGELTVLYFAVINLVYVLSHIHMVLQVLRFRWVSVLLSVPIIGACILAYMFA